ncbi:MAG: mechanosensitive ion channel family protein [Lysobacterales bacterium]
MATTASPFNLSPAFERLRGESEALMAALPMFMLALLVLWLAWVGGRWLSRRALLVRLASKRNPFLRELAATTVRWVVLLLGVVIALEILDATAMVGAVLGTAGVLGVALGFAFKDILENYLAGILMSLRQPFAPRDHVVIGGNEGFVVALNSRATILMTLDGNHLRLPNALVFRSVTLNYTRNPSRRFEFDIGIGVNDDLVRAQEIGIREMRAVAGVIGTPPPRAFITALGDSNVQVRFHGWVDQRENDFQLVRGEAIRRVKTVLESAGMDLPEPIYRVQLYPHPAADETSALLPGEARTALPQPTLSVGGRAAASTVRELAQDVDTRAHGDILAQVEQERNQRGASDLLDTDAPLE